MSTAQEWSLIVAKEAENIALGPRRTHISAYAKHKTIEQLQTEIDEIRKIQHELLSTPIEQRPEGHQERIYVIEHEIGFRATDLRLKREAREARKISEAFENAELIKALSEFDDRTRAGVAWLVSTLALMCKSKSWKYEDPPASSQPELFAARDLMRRIVAKNSVWSNQLRRDQLPGDSSFVKDLAKNKKGPVVWAAREITKALAPTSCHNELVNW